MLRNSSEKAGNAICNGDCGNFYGFFDWRKHPLQENEFTYHKESGKPALFGAFIFIIAIEAVALHFLIASSSTVAAWILTILSTYTAI